MEGPPKKKKKRTENWSLSDKALLKSLVEDNFAIIENKHVDTNTNKCKKDCWDSIMTLFNATSNVSRNVSQLQFQWRGMKYKAKTIGSNCRNEREDPAGNPSPKPPDKECADVMELIPNDFKIEFNKFEIHDVQQNSDQDDISLSQIKKESVDEEYDDYLFLDKNADESNVSTITPSSSTPKNIPCSENYSHVVPKKKLSRSSKKNNKNKNDEMKYKYEIFELTKKYMREEHLQRMENLRLENECRLKEMKKLDLEIEMMHKK